METVRDKWNRHWREKVGDIPEADSWLLRALPLLPRPGRALDIACGGGRNALFLAERGWDVTAVDMAEEGLALLQGDAARRNLTIDVRQTDLEADPVLPGGTYDLVILFFYLHRPLFPALKTAVAPGGVAVVRTFSAAGNIPGGPENPDFVLRPGELPEIFSGWEILLHEEGVEPAKRGGALGGIVARKPVTFAESSNLAPSS